MGQEGSCGARRRDGRKLLTYLNVSVGGRETEEAREVGWERERERNGRRRERSLKESAEAE
eukprot:28914-Pleurochrysis_carterae.AAC.2